MNDQTPAIVMADNLWKRIAIAATACILFVVLASSFTPDSLRAEEPATNPASMPMEVPISPEQLEQMQQRRTPTNTAPIPEQAIGDVASLDSDIIGTIEGTRYTVTVHAAVSEPLYSVFDRQSDREVASMMNAAELRAAFPELRDVQRALPGSGSDRVTQLMYVDPDGLF